MIVFDDEKQLKRLDELKLREEEQVVQILSEKYGIPYADLTIVPINTDGLRLIPEAIAREAQMACFDETGKKLDVAILSPTSEATLAVIKDLTERGYTVNQHLVSHQSLERAWEHFKDLSFATETHAGVLDISSEEIDKIVDVIKDMASIETLIKETMALKRSFRITRILEVTLAGAIAIGASDIHVEPEETSVRLRYRLDGVLTDVATIETDTYNLMLSRVKLLSGLKLNVKKEAQDGRFSIKIQDEEIEIRTSIIPGAYSESIVLRVLNPKAIAAPLEELGIEAGLMKTLLHQIARPNGMVLTTGPTGSGKTTTLYAFLRKIYSPEIKIITIENPIEYHLQGIVQTQVEPDKGYNFIGGLRSALRQDPEVIMVGEIRDEETAQTAVDAAQTGHLVFSTLHTNTAAGAFPRFISLGVNPKLLSSAINVAIAQRLLRKLCPICRKEVPLTDEKKTLAESILASVVKKEFVANLQTTTTWEPVGCEKCNKTGYKGRIGIFEAILMDAAIEKVIISDPSEREIAAAAVPQGNLTMQQDGIIKVLKGVTSFDELGRVIELTT